MIKLKVFLLSSLMDYMPDGICQNPFDWQMPEGSAVLDLIEQFSIPKKEVELIFVNDTLCKDLNRVIFEGDRIAVLPFTIGG